MEELCSLIGLVQNEKKIITKKTKEEFVSAIKKTNIKELSICLWFCLLSEGKLLSKIQVFFDKKKIFLLDVLFNVPEITKNIINKIPEDNEKKSVFLIFKKYLKNINILKLYITKLKESPKREKKIFFLNLLQVEITEQNHFYILPVFCDGLKEFKNVIAQITNVARGFDTEKMEELIEHLYCLLPVVDIEEIPNIVSFLLEKTTKENTQKTIKTIKEQIDFSELKKTMKTKETQKSCRIVLLHEIGRVLSKNNFLIQEWLSFIKKTENLSDFDLSVFIIAFGLNQNETNRKKQEKNLNDFLNQNNFILFVQTLEKILPECEWMQKLALKLCLIPQKDIEIEQALLLTVFSKGNWILKNEIIHLIFSHITTGKQDQVNKALDLLKHLAKKEGAVLSCFFQRLKTLVDFIGLIPYEQEIKCIEILLLVSFKEDKKNICDYLIVLAKKWCCHWENEYQKRGLYLIFEIIEAMCLFKKNIIIEEEICDLLDYVFTQSCEKEFYYHLNRKIEILLKQERVSAWIEEKIVNVFEKEFLYSLESFEDTKTRMFSKFNIEFSLIKQKDKNLFLGLLFSVFEESKNIFNIDLIFSICCKYYGKKKTLYLLNNIALLEPKFIEQKKNILFLTSEITFLIEAISILCLYEKYEEASSILEQVIIKDKLLNSFLKETDETEKKNKKTEKISDPILSKKIFSFLVETKSYPRKQKKIKETFEIKENVFSLLETETLTEEAFSFLLKKYRKASFYKEEILKKTKIKFSLLHDDFISGKREESDLLESILLFFEKIDDLDKIRQPFLSLVFEMKEEEISRLFEKDLCYLYSVVLSKFSFSEDERKKIFFFFKTILKKTTKRTNRKEFLFYLKQKIINSNNVGKTLLLTISKFIKRKKKKENNIFVHLNLFSFVLENGIKRENKKKILFLFQVVSCLDIISDFVIEMKKDRLLKALVLCVSSFIQKFLSSCMDYLSINLNDKKEEVFSILKKIQKITRKVQYLFRSIQNNSETKFKSSHVKKIFEEFLCGVQSLLKTNGESGNFLVGILKENSLDSKIQKV